MPKKSKKVDDNKRTMSEEICEVLGVEVDFTKLSDADLKKLHDLTAGENLSELIVNIVKYIVKKKLESSDGTVGKIKNMVMDKLHQRYEKLEDKLLDKIAEKLVDKAVTDVKHNETTKSCDGEGEDEAYN